MKRTAGALVLTALLAGGVAACGNSTAGSPTTHPTSASSRTADSPSISTGTARGRHNVADEDFLRAMRRMPGWSAAWGHGQRMRDWHPHTAVQRQQTVRLCRDELAHGNDPRLTLILFTLDETAYSRELAPLAGHYPALRLGPAWWFHDSLEGMRRYREQVTETAGVYNTVGN